MLHVGGEYQAVNTDSSKPGLVQVGPLSRFTGGEGFLRMAVRLVVIDSAVVTRLGPEVARLYKDTEDVWLAGNEWPGVGRLQRQPYPQMGPLIGFRVAEGGQGGDSLDIYLDVAPLESSLIGGDGVPRRIR